MMRSFLAGFGFWMGLALAMTGAISPFPPSWKITFVGVAMSSCGVVAWLLDRFKKSEVLAGVVLSALFIYSQLLVWCFQWHCDQGKFPLTHIALEATLVPIFDFCPPHPDTINPRVATSLYPKRMRADRLKGSQREDAEDWWRKTISAVEANQHRQWRVWLQYQDSLKRGNGGVYVGMGGRQ